MNDLVQIFLLHDPLNESPDEVEPSENELSPVYPPAEINSEISYDESGSEVDTSVPQSKRVKFNEKPQIKNLSDSSSESEEEEPEPPVVPPRKPTNRKKQVDPEPEADKITKKAKESKVSKSKKSAKGRKTTKNLAPDDVSDEKNEDDPSEEKEDVPAEKVVKPVKGRRAAHKKVAEPEVKQTDEQALKKGSRKKKIVSHIDQSIQDVGDPVTASTPMVEKPVSKKKKKKSPVNKAKALKSKARRRSSMVIRKLYNFVSFVSENVLKKYTLFIAARKSIEKAKTPIKSRIRSGIVSKKKTADSPELKTKSRKKIEILKTLQIYQNSTKKSANFFPQNHRQKSKSLSQENFSHSLSNFKFKTSSCKFYPIIFKIENGRGRNNA